LDDSEKPNSGACAMIGTNNRMNHGTQDFSRLFETVNELIIGMVARSVQMITLL
jgi:hypothetical protein